MSRLSLAGGLLAATAISFASFQASAQDSTPSGPWVTNDQTISLEGFLSNEELADRLMQIEKSSKGLVSVEVIGESGEGRPLWLAKVGNPEGPSVMIFTQQHGDEPHGTESAMHILKTLSTGSAAARAITDNIQVLIIPRVNPDGAEIPTRGNADFTAPRSNTGQCPAAGGSNNNGLGIYTTYNSTVGGYSYDINRYHWPVWEESWQYLCNVEDGVHIYPENPVPEALAVLGVQAEYQPLWGVDIHNQGFNYIDDETCDTVDYCRDGQYVTGSILWPTNADVDPAIVDYSKQMALVMKKRSMEIGHVELTRYSGGDFAGIARNAYGLLGGGSILFEVVGQTEGSNSINNGQKAIGKVVNGVTKVMMALLEATADGSLEAEDPNEADEIIVNNDRGLRNPHRD